MQRCREVFPSRFRFASDTPFFGGNDLLSSQPRLSPFFRLMLPVHLFFPRPEKKPLQISPSHRSPQRPSPPPLLCATFFLQPSSFPSTFPDCSLFPPPHDGNIAFPSRGRAASIIFALRADTKGFFVSPPFKLDAHVVFVPLDFPPTAAAVVHSFSCNRAVRVS